MRDLKPIGNMLWAVLFVFATTFGFNGCGNVNDVADNPPSAVANLANLTVTPGTLQPAFSSDVINYTVDVTSSVTSVAVTAQPQDAGATVSINGQTTTSSSVSLEAPGSSTPISIIVTAQNGNQKPYTVIVNRAGFAGNTNLQSLTVTPGTLVPAFIATTTGYTVDVASGVDSVTVTTQPQDAGATVSINGQTTTSRSVSLGASGSSTLITIVVTAPNLSQKTYLVTVNRFGTNNANLSNLTVTPGSLSPGFTPNNTGPYTVDVASTVGSVTVTATKSDTNATVSINGVIGTSRTINLPVAPSTTEINVLVIAQDGVTSKTYVVNVNRLGANNANLSNLTVTPGSLSPGFTPNNTGPYTVDVASTVGSVTVTATKSDTNATVSINGVIGTSRTINLPVAPSTTEINVLVIAQDGVTSKTYVVNVNRLEANDANLSNLTVTPGSLSPGFTPNNTGPYTVDVASTVDSVTVTATKSDTNATVSINGMIGTSRTINLLAAPSTEQVDVLVIAQDGVTSKTYVVNVNRLGANNANLSDLTVTPGSLSPGFTPNNTGPYTVDVASTVDSVTVTATKSDTNATVSINGVIGTSRTINLLAAPSTEQVDVLVIAQDGVTSKTYVVNVNRLGANNANLSDLTVTPGSLSPGFTPNNTGPYTVDVASTVDSVTVTATKSDTNATVSINGVIGTSRTINLLAAPSTEQVDILVIAQDTVTTTTYTVMVNRLSP